MNRLFLVTKTHCSEEYVEYNKEPFAMAVPVTIGLLSKLLEIEAWCEQLPGGKKIKRIDSMTDSIDFYWLTQDEHDYVENSILPLDLGKEWQFVEIHEPDSVLEHYSSTVTMLNRFTTHIYEGIEITLTCEHDYADTTYRTPSFPPVEEIRNRLVSFNTREVMGVFQKDVADD